MKLPSKSETLILALSLIALGMGVAHAQESTTVKKVPVHPTQAISGKDLYREFCAVCHGTAGKGDGPAASALKNAPADLTQISSKNGGKFPELKVQHMINGEMEQPIAHGSKDMPVWGNVFRHMGPNEDLGAVRVYNLLKYIEQIQAK